MRVYDEPITPYQRVMLSPDVQRQYKDKLRDWHDTLNPVLLVKEEALVRKKIDYINKNLKDGSAIRNQKIYDVKRPVLFQQNDVHKFRVS